MQALFTSVSQLDLTGLLADLDPEELAAVDAYAGDWLPSAQSALDKLQGQVNIQFGNLNFTTQSVDGGTLVKIGSGLSLNVAAHGVDVQYANGCYTVTGPNTSEHKCVSNGDQYEDQLLALLPAPVQPIFKRLDNDEAGHGFCHHRRKWGMVREPTRTYLNGISDLLSEFQPGDIQTIIENASGIGNAIEKYERQEMNGKEFKLPSETFGTVTDATRR